MRVFGEGASFPVPMRSKNCLRVELNIGKTLRRIQEVERFSKFISLAYSLALSVIDTTV